jgi:tetratricopeptide (TPR) repeat protein
MVDDNDMPREDEFEVVADEPQWADDEPVWADSGDVSASDESEDADDGFADDGDFDDEESETPAPAPDPMVNVLLIATMSLIVVLLATTAGLFIYLSALNKAPRTRAERDVTMWETAVREKPNDANSWASLAYAYSDAGRTDEAIATVRRGAKVIKQESLVLIEADILRAAKRYKDAVKKYDQAERAIKESREKANAELRKKGIKAGVDDGSLARAYLGRGLAKSEIKDLDGAISDLEKSVKDAPTQADVWTMLGDLYREAGQTEQAAAAYKRTLEYIPDYKQALDGLAKLKEGK